MKKTQFQVFCFCLAFTANSGDCLGMEVKIDKAHNSSGTASTTSSSNSSSSEKDKSYGGNLLNSNMEIENFLQKQRELFNNSAKHFTENELETIYEKASPVSSSISDNSNVALIKQALAGNPKAIYELADEDGGMARVTYNEEKNELLFERAVLLLIAATKGKYNQAEEDLDYAAEILSKRIKYKELNSFEAIKRVAQFLHEEL